MNDKSVIEAEHDAGEDSCSSHCKEVTSLLMGKISHDMEIRKVQDEFEIRQLEIENKEADDKIAYLLKRVEEEEKISANLDRQIRASTSRQSQTIARKQHTGEILNVLKNEIDAKKKYCSSAQAELKDLKIKFAEYGKLNKKVKLYRKKVAHLKSQIQKALNDKDGNSSEVDPNLIKENELLKKTLEEKIKKLQEKKSKAKRFKMLKAENDDLLDKMKKEQERKLELDTTLSDKLEQMKNHEEKTKKEFDEMEKKNNALVQKSSLLRADVAKAGAKKQINIEELEKSNLALERQIEETKLKTAQMEAEMENNLEMEKNRLDMEKKKFEAVNMKHQCLAEELVELNNTKQAKLQQKSEIEQCTIQLFKTKYEYAKKEVEIVNLNRTLDSITDEINSNKAKLESLQTERSILNKEIIEMEEYQPSEDKRMDALTIEFEENKNKLMKQRDFMKASMDLLQFKLDNMNTELANLHVQQEDVETEIKVDKIKLDTLLNHVELKNQRLNKEKIEYNAALEKYNRLMEEDKNEAMIPKSSGILKDPRSPKRPVTPTKNVRFENLSSTTDESQETSPFDFEIEKAIKSLEDFDGKPSSDDATHDRQIN